MRKKFYVYGNCQARPLARALNESKAWRKEYNLAADIIPVHKMDRSNISNFHRIIKTVDVFIYQNVSNTYDETLSTEYLLKLLKPSCESISFPSAFFKGYNPEIVYIKNKQGQKIPSPTGGYDFLLLHEYLTQNKKVSTFHMNYGKLNYLSTSFLDEYLGITINELNQREEKLNIRVVRFIEDNWSSSQLFHTVNHPANKLLFYLANEILKFLKFPLLTKQESSKEYEFQGWSKIPLYRDIVDRKKLNNYNDKVFIARKQSNIETYVNEQVKIYDQIDKEILCKNYEKFIENDKVIGSLYSSIV